MDIFKKSLYAGVGLAYMTKDKIEELAKELTDKGKMTEKEGKEFIDELLEKSKEAKIKVESQIDSTVKDTLKKMNLVTKKEYDELERRLNNLEEKMKSS